MISQLRKIYGARPLWAHKGDFGSVLVVGGSERCTGSPIFNSIAALRSGADLAYVVGHRRAMDTAAHFTPDLITAPLRSEFSISDIPIVTTLSKRSTSMVIGGGLARADATYRAIRKAIALSTLPTVIDAEAIRALGKHPGIIFGKSAILTPHADEFYALTGEQVLPTVSDRKIKVQRTAKKLGMVILLKGAVDVISDGKRTHLNRTGNASMTKGGFGDTLAGICSALLARGVDPFTAACTAAYINGKAGEYASKKYGEGTLASDLLGEIPRVLVPYSRNATV